MFINKLVYSNLTQNCNAQELIILHLTCPTVVKDLVKSFQKQKKFSVTHKQDHYHHAWGIQKE